MIWMCFCFIEKDLKKLTKKVMLPKKKTNCNPKIYIYFDLNSNKITYTCPKLIIYILNESL